MNLNHLTRAVVLLTSLFMFQYLDLCTEVEFVSKLEHLDKHQEIKQDCPWTSSLLLHFHLKNRKILALFNFDFVVFELPSDDKTTLCVSDTRPITPLCQHLRSTIDGAALCLCIFKMEAANRKRKRDFQDLEDEPALDSSLNVESCGLSSILLVRKRRKSVGTAELSSVCKVSEPLNRCFQFSNQR